MKQKKFNYTRKQWYQSKIKQGFTVSSACYSVIDNFAKDFTEYCKLYRNIHWNKIACTFKSDVI